jgi:hypothetical protein
MNRNKYKWVYRNIPPITPTKHFTYSKIKRQTKYTKINKMSNSMGSSCTIETFKNFNSKTKFNKNQYLEDGWIAKYAGQINGLSHHNNLTMIQRWTLILTYVAVPNSGELAKTISLSWNPHLEFQLVYVMRDKTKRTTMDESQKQKCSFCSVDFRNCYSQAVNAYILDISLSS